MGISFRHFYGLILLSFFITSCSTSDHIRKGRYSSVDKRDKTNANNAEEKKYTDFKTKKDLKNENASLPTSSLRKNIVNTAIAFQGTSYKSGGKSPEMGFDCSGFTRFIFGENGITLTGSSDKIAQMGKQKSREDLLPGDLVFFGNAERISHVAIVADNRQDKLEVIHATTSAGVKIDIISGYDYWERRFLFGKDIISK